MIVWLASYPRSGNTFFRVLMKHLYGIKTYSIYNDSLFSEIGASEMIGHEDLPASIEELSRSSRLYLIKTHGLPTDDSPVIYLVRDGRDSIVSYARYMMSFGEKKEHWNSFMRAFYFKRELKKLVRSDEGYGRWSDHVMAWTALGKIKQISILKFEELIVSPAESVQACLNELSLGLKPIQSGSPSFIELHEKWPDFFRKGKTGTWKSEMPSDIHEMFWKYHHVGMKHSGYQR